MSSTKTTGRRRGNPNWVAGVSGNPAGRPRTGTALAEAIREHVDPEEWVRFELSVARDEKQSLEKRAAAWHALVDRGFPKPATTLLHGDAAEPLDLSHLSSERIEQLLAELQPPAGSSDLRSHDASVAVDDAPRDTGSGT